MKYLKDKNAISSILVKAILISAYLFIVEEANSPVFADDASKESTVSVPPINTANTEKKDDDDNVPSRAPATDDDKPLNMSDLDNIPEPSL